MKEFHLGDKVRPTKDQLSIYSFLPKTPGIITEVLSGGGYLVTWGNESHIFYANELEIAKGNKFNARKVQVDSYTFDSGTEYERYLELKILEAAGEISYLTVHPAYDLLPKFTDNEGVKERAVTYKPDFSYREMCPDGSSILVVEDVKSEPTAKKRDYVIIRKLFKTKYPHIHFREITS